MPSQGLPFSFLPAHLGINYSPPSPLVVLCDGFMSAGISQRSPRRSRRSARHFVDPRSSSCSRCEVERLSSSVSILIYLGPFTRFTEDSEFTAQTCYVSQTCYVRMVWKLRASTERAQKELTGRS